MSDPVILAAADALRGRLRGTSDVSMHTRDAQRIAKLWRTTVVALDPGRYQHEVSVDPAFDQRIDIVDSTGGVAYELKVSGKNAHSELYKDIVKILLWNQRRRNSPIVRLVFITDRDHGQRLIDTPMINAYRAFLRDHGLQVDVEYVGVG